MTGFKKQRKTTLLTKKCSTIIKPKPPFNFDGTAHKPSHHTDPDIYYIKGKMWWAINLNEKIYGIKIENKGKINSPKLKVTIFSKRKLSDKEKDYVLNEIKWYLDLDTDISDFCNRFKSDNILSPILKRCKGMRVNSLPLYEYLMITILLQNATYRRTLQMMNNLLNKYGNKVKFDGKELFVFWSPNKLKKVSEKKLRILKVGYRAKMIKKISEGFIRKEIDEMAIRKMNKDDAKNELLKLYGIGPASVNTILFETLHHYDAFDLKGRVWDQKLYSRIFFNKKLVPPDKITKEVDKRYGKWKALACHYILEDLFWRRQREKIDWLEKEIRI